MKLQATLDELRLEELGYDTSMQELVNQRTDAQTIVATITNSLTIATSQYENTKNLYNYIEEDLKKQQTAL